MTPLHIQIAIHYHVSRGPYAHGTPHGNSTATNNFTDELYRAGLLRWNEEQQCFEGTEACKVWVNALCAVPLPVQQWVIPKSEI